MLVLNTSLSSGVPGTSWATWSEATEAGWTGIGTNTAIWFMKSGVSQDETGQGGGLTGADLVLTQNGDIPASSGGTRPYRQLTADGDYFIPTVTACDLITGAAFTVVVKIENWTAGDALSIGSWALPNQDFVQLIRGGTNQLTVDWRDANVQRISGTTTDAFPTSGIVWVALWNNNAANKCGAGFTTSGSGANGQPTKLSDFPVNSRITGTGSTSWVAGDHDANNFFGYGGNAYMTGRLYYVVMSNTCLFDLSA